MEPVNGLYAAVSRQTLSGEPTEGWFPDQRLTIEKAIEAATKNPAWASFEEDLGLDAPGPRRRGTRARRANWRTSPCSTRTS